MPTIASDLDVAVYDFRLNFLAGTHGRDHLSVFPDGRTYLVGDNSPLKPLARARVSDVFVIGATLAGEANDLHGVIFSDIPPGGWPNVFSLETNWAKERVEIRRLTSGYRQFLRHAIPTLGGGNTAFTEERSRTAELFRSRIALHDSAQSTALQEQLAGLLPSCRRSWPRSIEAAELAYVLHRRRLPTLKAARKFAATNVAGDSRLIAEALFTGFAIVSADETDVHAMAALTGLKVVSHYQLLPVTDG